MEQDANRNDRLAWLKTRISSPEVLALLALAVFLAVWYLLPPSFFETDDDAYFSLNFSGRIITEHANSFVIHVNVILGTILSALYKSFSRVAWHGVTQALVVCVSVGFIVYVIVQRQGGRAFFVAASATVFLFSGFAVSLQFTKTSFLASAAGLLGLLLCLQADASRRRTVTLGIAILLMAFGACLRLESFLLALFLCSLLLVEKLWFASKQQRVVAALAFALVLLLVVVDNASYQGDWRDYKSVSRKIALLVNFNKVTYEANEAAFQKVGWSRNDYYLLKDFGYADPELYAEEKVDLVLDEATVENAYDKAQVLNSIRYETKYYLGMVALLAVGIVWAGRPGLRQVLLILGPWVVCAGFLYYSGRMPARVSVCLAAFLPLALAASCPVSARAIRQLGLLLVLLPCLYLFGKDVQRWQFYASRNAQLRTLVANADLITRHSDYRVVVWGPSMAFSALEPFRVPTVFQKNNLVWLSMLNLSPLQRQQLSGTGSVFRTLLDDKRTLIVMSEDQAKMLTRYYAEHAGVAVKINPLWNVGGITFYQVSAAG